MMHDLTTNVPAAIRALIEKAAASVRSAPVLAPLIAAALIFASCGRDPSLSPGAVPAAVNPDVGADATAAAQPSFFVTPSLNDRAESSKKVYFDTYILRAVTALYANYKMLGYDLNQLYTHELAYGSYGMLLGTPGTKTMCVAAQVEVIMTALEIYVRETGDKSVYDFLPIQSWRGLTINDIKGHIWVNSKFDSYGTGDALAHFGMGEVTPFEKLQPGAFINFSRTTKTGHAVTFLAFIDKDGKEYDTYNAGVIGFKYFSAQGIKEPATAGFDFRYAVFNQFGCPDMPYKNDCNIIASKKRSVFVAGRMWAPKSWTPMHPKAMRADQLGESVLNANFYTGE